MSQYGFCTYAKTTGWPSPYGNASLSSIGSCRIFSLLPRGGSRQVSWLKGLQPIPPLWGRNGVPEYGLYSNTCTSCDAHLLTSRCTDDPGSRGPLRREPVGRWSRGSSRRPSLTVSSSG